MASQPPLKIASYLASNGTFQTYLPFDGKRLGSAINGVGGAFTGGLNLADRRVRQTDPIDATIPGRTIYVAEFDGVPIEAYWAAPRSRRYKGQRLLVNGAPQSWAYYGQRDQVADYSSPPNSSLASPMALWNQQPFDAGMVLAQVFSDVQGYRWAYQQGAIAHGLGTIGQFSEITYNGTLVVGNSPITQVPSSNWVAPTFPLSSLQTIASIFQQITGFGYLTGVDFVFKPHYVNGPMSDLWFELALSYPRAGRTAAQSGIVLNGKLARDIAIDEDSGQQGTMIAEMGVQGAVLFYDNVYPIEQGWPIIDRNMSHSGVIGPNYLALLTPAAQSDSFLYSFPPVAPVFTMPIGGVDSSGRTFGPPGAPQLVKGGALNITPGDDCYAKVDPCPILPNGMYAPGSEYRIVQWDVDWPDEGDATVDYTLNLPPAAVATGPII
jgi:hypothetical protein